MEIQVMYLPCNLVSVKSDKPIYSIQWDAERDLSHKTQYVFLKGTKAELERRILQKAMDTYPRENRITIHRVLSKGITEDSWSIRKPDNSFLNQITV